MKTTTAVLVMVGTLFCSMSYAHARTEKLAIDKNGIKVWTYQVDNNPMMQYRAETVLNTSLENAVGLVLDTERGERWIPNVSSIKVLEKNEKIGKFIFYMVLDFPFPLSDRDLIVEGNLTKVGDKIIFKNQTVTDSRAPAAGKNIRITNYQGDWTFQKIDAGHVRVSTSGFVDPAGSIPTAFVNSFVQQQPYTMLQQMQKQIKLTHYSLKDLPEVLQ